MRKTRSSLPSRVNRGGNNTSQLVPHLTKPNDSHADNTADTLQITLDSNNRSTPIIEINSRATGPSTVTNSTNNGGSNLSLSQDESLILVPFTVNPGDPETQGAVLTAHISKDKSVMHPLAESVNRSLLDELQGNDMAVDKHEDSGIFLTLINAIRSQEKAVSSDHPRSISNTGAAIANGSDIAPAAHSKPSQALTHHSLGSGTFVSRLETLLKPAKVRSSKTLFEEGDGKDDKDDKTAIENLESPTGATTNPTEAINDDENLNDIHFSSVRESPLQTLGKGNLSLAAFDELKPLEAEHDSRSRANLSPARFVNDNLSVEDIPKTRALSPSVSTRGRQASSSSKKSRQLLQSEGSAFNGSSNGDSADKAHIDETLDKGGVPLGARYKFASRKRNDDFHSRFKRIPANERLIDDFLCAILKDILIQGRIYVSQKHICFDLNILGFVTSMVIPLQEVIQIEKKATAVLFPNGMVIRTLHHKYVFATMINRDTIFGLITEVWHGSLLEGSGSAGRNRLQSQTSNGKDDTFSYDEGDEDDDNVSEGNSDDDDDLSNNGDETDLETLDEDSGENKKNNVDSDHGNSETDEDKKGKSDGKKSGSFKGLPVVGPTTHEPTSNGYTKDSNDTFICDETIPAPLGAVYNLMFGEDTLKYAQILKDGKNFDITEDSIVPLSSSGTKERKYAYTKPLSGPIGPKQTRCNLTDTLILFLTDSVIVVEQVSRTPDVPSGNSFLVKTKIFLSWGAKNSTAMYVVTSVDWTGKLWIKGAIEKGSIDGQKESMKGLVQSLNNFIQDADKGDGKRSRGKSISKRKRRNTVKLNDAPVPAPALQEEAPKTIAGQVAKLLETIGSSIPVQVPYLDDLAVGAMVVVIGYFCAVKSTKVAFSLFGSHHSGSGVVFKDGPISKVNVNGESYAIIQPVKSILADPTRYKDAEIAMWQWLRERGAKNVPGEPVGREWALKLKGLEYSKGDVKDMVDLIQLKLDEIQKSLV